MTTQTCFYNVCFPVPDILGGLFPSAASSASSAAATASTTAAATGGAAGGGTTATVTSAVQTVTQMVGTVTQTATRVVTQTAAAGGGTAGTSGAAGASGAGSSASGGLPTALPSGFVLPDNFQLPAGFKLPPKPAYQFDVDDRLVEAVIYAILLFPTLYLLFKHGKRGLLVWPALAAFCIIRIAADAMFMWPTGDLMKVGAGWVVTSAMSLVILIMLPIGLNFEASSYMPSTSKALRLITLIVLGFITLLGLILGTIGAVPLSLIAQIKNKPYNLKMARAGYILLLLVLIFTLFQALYFFMKSSRPIEPLSQRKRIRALLLGSVLSIPFIAVRVGRSIDYSFNYKPSRNPINGSYVTIFVFVFLMQLLAYLIIFAAGFMSHRIKHPREVVAHTRGAAVTGDSESDLKAEESGRVGRRHMFRQNKHTAPAEGGYYNPKQDELAREV